jgi:hypothetical protein
MSDDLLAKVQTRTGCRNVETVGEPCKANLPWWESCRCTPIAELVKHVEGGDDLARIDRVMAELAARAAAKQDANDKNTE